MTTFESRVWAIVRQVPLGRVTTYGHIAMLAGAPGRARQVGRALRQLPPYLTWGDPAAAEADDRSAVPWHRVVNAKGRVSPRGDPSDVARQAALLRAEGLAVTDDSALAGSLEQVGWWPEEVVVRTD